MEVTRTGNLSFDVPASEQWQSPNEVCGNDEDGGNRQAVRAGGSVGDFLPDF